MVGICVGEPDATKGGERRRSVGRDGRVQRSVRPPEPKEKLGRPMVVMCDAEGDAVTQRGLASGFNQRTIVVGH